LRALAPRSFFQTTTPLKGFLLLLCSGAKNPFSLGGSPFQFLVLHRARPWCIPTQAWLLVPPPGFFEILWIIVFPPGGAEAKPSFFALGVALTLPLLSVPFGSSSLSQFQALFSVRAHLPVIIFEQPVLFFPPLSRFFTALSPPRLHRCLGQKGSPSTRFVSAGCPACQVSLFSFSNLRRDGTGCDPFSKNSFAASTGPTPHPPPAQELVDFGGPPDVGPRGCFPP